MRLYRPIVEITVLMASAGLALAGGPKLSKDLQSMNPSTDTDVIIQYRQRPTTADHQQVGRRGGKLTGELGLINAATYHVSAGALRDLVQSEDVVYASPDRKVHSQLDFAAPAVGADLALGAGWDGAGVGIAIIDSGIFRSHPDLAKKGKPGTRVAYSEAFDGSNGNDANGHGTHVAGIVAGSANAST